MNRRIPLPDYGYFLFQPAYNTHIFPHFCTVLVIPFPIRLRVSKARKECKNSTPILTGVKIKRRSSSAVPLLLKTVFTSFPFHAPASQRPRAYILGITCLPRIRIQEFLLPLPRISSRMHFRYFPIRIASSCRTPSLSSSHSVLYPVIAFFIFSSQNMQYVPFCQLEIFKSGQAGQTVADIFYFAGMLF